MSGRSGRQLDAEPWNFSAPTKNLCVPVAVAEPKEPFGRPRQFWPAGAVPAHAKVSVDDLPRTIVELATIAFIPKRGALQGQPQDPQCRSSLPAALPGPEKAHWVYRPARGIRRRRKDRLQSGQGNARTWLVALFIRFLPAGGAAGFSDFRGVRERQFSLRCSGRKLGSAPPVYGLALSELA